MIRRALPADIDAMIGVIEENKARSVYAEGVGIDRRLAFGTMMNCIQRHGARGANAAWCMVSERDGAVDGLIVGVLNPVYMIGDLCTATDLWWVSTDRTSARDRVGLMLSMVDWAKAHRKVFDIVCAASGAVTDPARVDKIMVALGFVRFGGLWRIEVKK